MGLKEEHDGDEVPLLPYYVEGIHDIHVTPRVITFITWLRWYLPDSPG